MSNGDGKTAPGGVRAALQQLTAAERERLVKALAEVLIEQIREQRRVESMRRLK